MHECTFPIWVIFITAAAIFSVVTGIFDLCLPKTTSGKIIISENNEICARSRIGPWKVFVTDFVLLIPATALFLWQYFATTESSFNDFLSTIGSIGVILGTIILAIIAWIILFLSYALFSYLRESSIEAKYSLIQNADVRITFIN